MKKIVALLLTLALLAGCALAEADVAPAGEARALPQVGEAMHGFTVVGVYPYDSMGAQAVEFVHDKTGATLIWVANDSTDRAFVVGFRTHVTDDKGVPHVFEHATISSSEKYPNPNQFMTALYGTYNTYMNAMTSRTFTYYPSSSLSEDQLLKYVDFYMDGVYHPLVLTDERLLRREAYRYELPSADSELTLQGTVYSEMLGALTQEVDAYYHATRAAFPGSVVGSITGGVPGVIETMTLQDVVDFHDTYYHPSNSLMVLYGDLDVEPFLELIDGEYLSKFDRAEIDLSDSGYEPLTGDVEEDITFPVGANDAAETYMFYTVPLPGMNLVELHQLSLALSVMMQNGQPFDQMIKERLPGASIRPGYNTEGPCPSVYFEVVGASAEQKDEAVAVIREGIAEAVEDGLDPELLASSVLSERIADAQIEDTMSAVDAASKIVSFWGFQGDPLAFLAEDTFLGNLQTYLDEGAYDAVLEKYLADPAATCLLVSTGEPGRKEQQDAELAQRLAEKKAAMSEEEIAELVAEHDELERWNAENEASVSVTPLMAVDAQSLPEEVVVHTAKDEDVDGLRVVSSEVDSDLMKIELYIDASGVPADRLDEASLAVGLLGLLSTENCDAAELTTRTASVTDLISTELTTIMQEDWSYVPYLHVAFDCFPEHLDGAFDLVEEMLLRTGFDPAEVRDLCAYYAPAGEAGIDPYEYACDLASAAFSEAAAYQARVGGAGFVKALKRVSEMDDAELEPFARDMAGEMAALCCGDGMILTVAGSAENIAAATQRAQELRGKLTAPAREAADYSEALASPKNVAATYGSDAMYNVVMLPFKELGIEYNGKLRAFSAAVESTVLIPVMRNAYSVYTPMAALNRNWAGIIAYRDPRLRETFTEVLPSLSEQVRALDLTQDELDGYIVSAYSTLAAPHGPFYGANTAIQDALCNRNSFERMRTQMRELKQTTPEDIAAYADIFDAVAERGARASVGSPQLIEQNRDLFDEVDTWLTD